MANKECQVLPKTKKNTHKLNCAAMHERKISVLNFVKERVFLKNRSKSFYSSFNTLFLYLHLLRLFLIIQKRAKQKKTIVYTFSCYL